MRDRMCWGFFCMAGLSLTFPNSFAGYTCLGPSAVSRIPSGSFCPILNSPACLCIFFTLFLSFAPKALSLHTSWGSHSTASAFYSFRPRWLLPPTSLPSDNGLPSASSLTLTVSGDIHSLKWDRPSG